MSTTTKENYNLVIELRKQGKTYKQIQEEVGVCKNTIIKILRENNMISSPKQELTPELLAIIQSRYDEIHNIKKVAKEFGISYERLRKNINIKEAKPFNKLESQKNYYKQVKLKAIEYKGNKCQVCGYNRCIQALEFHHLDPTKKDFTTSGGTKSFQNIKSELDKCVLLCANCHREVHNNIITI